MRFIQFLCIPAAIIVFLTDTAFSQISGAYSIPRVSVGVQGAPFRVSYGGFDDVYGGRWGLAWGGHATVRLTSLYNVAVKYRRFTKSNDVQQANGSRSSQEWQEQWINVGVRYTRWSDSGRMSFFGFGLSFFSIDENGALKVLPRTPGSSGDTVSASGFYLDLGLSWPLHKIVALMLEIEVTSATVEGRGGFETSSVGGFFVGAGLNFFPF